jgi:hypothetical protein
VVTGRRQKERFHPFNRLTNLSAEHCLREALAALIEDAYAIADAAVVIKVDSCPTPGGEIHVPLSESEKMAVLRYGSLNKSRLGAARASQIDLIQSRFVSFDTVKRLAAIMRSGEKPDRRAFHG